MAFRSRRVGAVPKALGLCFLVLALSMRLEAAAPAAETLPPGVVRERSLAVGERHTYRPQLIPGRRWVVRLEQLGVDVALAAQWPGAAPLRVDSPLDRDGTELLLLPPAAVRGVELTVIAQAVAGEAGSYRIRLDAVDERGEDPSRLTALETMTEAAQAYAAGGGEGRRRALAAYRTAAELWRGLQSPRLAAQCLYAAAVLHRLLGEGTAALELAREVLPRWRALGNAGREADTLNEIGLLESAAGRAAEARASFQQALAVQERAGDRFRQAATANNLCLTYLVQGEHRQALACYGPALARIRAAGDEEHEAVALSNLGWAYKSLGQPEEALDHFHRAVALHRAAGRGKREAETLNNLAVLHRQLGEPQEALVLYLRALTIFRQQGDRRWEARVLHNLGAVYQVLGDPERALVFYHQALALKRQLGDRRGEAGTLKVLGHVELEAGRAREAEEMFGRALELERLTGDRRGEAVALRSLGQAHAARGDHGAALDFFARALTSSRAHDDRGNEARTLLHRGRALGAVGRLRQAAASLSSAAEIYRALDIGLGESEALYRLAETERAAGHDARALNRVDEAISLFASLRAAVDDPDLQATFAGLRRGAYELRIELLMARYDAGGDVRHLRAALETSEQARAQGLLALLRQAGVETLSGTAPALTRRLRSLRRRLHVHASQRRKLLSHQSSAAALRTAEVDFFQTLAELERLEAEIRRQHPEYAALRQPSPLTVAAVQGLLEPGTALLEYALGRERSFLFLVTGETIRAFELPPRQALEEAARRAYEELSAPYRGGGEAAGLAELVLAPALEELVAEELVVERLVVVADGALHYLPFAALPLPVSAGGEAGGPLLTRYEVVHLPSASTLAAERRRSAGRPPAPRWAAVVADPVFDRRDLRLVAARAGDDTAGDDTAGGSEADSKAEMPRGPADDRQPQDLALPRLRMSRREAENIAALAPAGEVLVALDFDADRDLVLDGRLADYRIVHFATHGLIDARYPALSGLALSHFDRHGQARDGFLRLRDIYGLRLGADLVVLSACRTALGKEVRGEGLLGLSRGFFHAGARRIVASLWSVPDRATAELMARFYHAMVKDELAPAAALRQAQLSMLGERRWRDPHNWAGFVLLGDWR